MVSEFLTTLTMTEPSSTFEFSRWQEPHFRPVNQFYRRQKHKGSASGDEQVFIGKDQEEVIVSAVRLVPNDGFFWLRSLYVEHTLRGQNLGSSLLEFVHQHTQLPIYCFPYSHLQSFYERAGYTLVSPNDLPNDLNQLFTRYKGKGENILAMARN